MVIQPQHGQNIHQKRYRKFGKNSSQKKATKRVRHSAKLQFLMRMNIFFRKQNFPIRKKECNWKIILLGAH